MREVTVENKVKAMVKVLGGLCLKFASPGFTGVPDRIILLPGGRIVFAEIKAPGEKPRPRQKRVHEQLRRLGFTVLVIDDADKFWEEINNG